VGLLCPEYVGERASDCYCVFLGIDETKQETKAGANKFAYWVTQNIESGQWTKLPNVTMTQIVASRQFKRFLTGNLEAAVPAYPPFNGVEKHFLRTQIARIVGSTSVSPDGYYALDDNDPPAVVPAEAEAFNEAFPKAAQDLKDPEAWKHHEIELNKLGRVTAMPEILGMYSMTIMLDAEVVFTNLCLNRR
jgi:radial spoke head protein 4A